MHRFADRRLPVLLSVAVVLFTIAPATARSQTTVETTPALLTGDTLRVWAPTSSLDGVIGTFARIDVRDLVIAGQSANPLAPPREVAVPLSNIVRLDVLRSKKKSGRRIFAGIVIGAGVGALIGAPLGPLLECGGACDDTGELTPMVGPGLGASIGAGIGALLGGVVGGMSRPRWETVTFTVR